MATPYAFVTLVTSDSYLPGALAVAAALKDLHPLPAVPPEVDFQTVCLVAPENVDVSSIKLLRKAFDSVVGVELIEQEDDRGLQLLGRLDLNNVLTKLHIFRLTQYSKIIFLDADVLPIRPLSHLFTLPHEFSAVPDVGWPDIFNSGVLVATPGNEKFEELRELLKSKGSWDGGDQGLLNEWRGSNWHRLSFTYNTTPTAAYTYAPAYERFGSKISAIHFIGKNKPWKDIPWRAPGAKSSEQEQLGPLQSYDYSTLVDRWYNVYDRHYRSDSPTSRANFEVQRYASVWDQGGNDIGAELPPISAGFSVSNSPGAVLGLEDLKRFAVEGSSSFSGTTAHVDQPQEGEYRSMPLDGRVDLMRPKREHIHEHDHERPDSNSSTPVQRPRSLGDLPRMETLPTPGPNEVPPAPYMHGHSLPPTPYNLQQQQYFPSEHYYGQQFSQQGQDSSADEHDASYQNEHGRHASQDSHHDAEGGQNTRQDQSQHRQPHMQQPPSQHQYHGQHQQSQGEHHEQSHLQSEWQHHQSQQGSQNYDNRTQQNTSEPQQNAYTHQHDSQHHPPRSQPRLPPIDTRHDHNRPHHHSQHHQHHHHVPPPRPASPPKLSWNAAIEPPPNNPPAVSAFPEDTYFPNVWDQTPGKQHDATHQSPHVSDPRSDAFFHPPPPSVIPEQLLRDGQYANVLGPTPDIHPGSPPPMPDRSKVHAVFPWEGKPRHMPRRVFPKSDSPPPAAEFIESPRSSSSIATPSPVERPLLHIQTPSPPVGLPFNLTYMNAWDAVPSIQRYASKLARPHTVHPASTEHDEGWRKWEKERERQWQEHQDASSMDGDDEDDGDDVSLKSESEGSRERARRSRTGSTVSATSPVLVSKGKRYRGRGVQTVTVETRSQGVQASVLADTSTYRPRRDSRTQRGGAHARREWPSMSSASNLLPSAVPRDFRAEPEQNAAVTPSISHPHRASAPFPTMATPTGLRSPQTLGSPRTYSPPNMASTPPKAPTPPKAYSPVKAPTPPKMSPKVASPVKASSPRQVVSPRTGPISFKAHSPVMGPGAFSPQQSTPSPKISKLTSPLSPPMPMGRSWSNDTALSSPSTQAVMTPENSPPAARRPSRVFDPARGIDVFKRGSEEVLARFLRMGSFEEEDGHKHRHA